ncbi:unnamed protein product [Lepeophtheirus salmonis]|uniref:(salmon louse) hypothetical protein n=1 Tax=Lepeophtheirus salmonis TaxID=72036 RepID=A0A7R8H107_LEPSM|nr:unnamed protein product [Lepeophtheirus salmonis]CAF2799127.1 unnamed protein product [Lepeophtheirus salmonis]
MTTVIIILTSWKKQRTVPSGNILQVCLSSPLGNDSESRPSAIHTKSVVHTGVRKTLVNLNRTVSSSEAVRTSANKVIYSVSASPTVKTWVSRQSFTLISHCSPSKSGRAVAFKVTNKIDASPTIPAGT